MNPKILSGYRSGNPIESHQNRGIRLHIYLMV